MKYKILSLALLIPLLSACHTMHFKKAASSPTSNIDIVGQDFDNWHHIGIISLVEFSEPISTKNQNCSSWSSVTVQRSFLPGLVGSLPYVGYLYSPWDAYMNCN